VFTVLLETVLRFVTKKSPRKSDLLKVRKTSKCCFKKLAPHFNDSVKVLVGAQGERCHVL
jgi:hypothetical protein